jgi:hypothetical protein
MIPAVFLTTVAGLYWASSNPKKFTTAALYIVVFTYLTWFSFYLHTLLTSYRLKYEKAWQGGNKAMVESAKSLFSHYDELIITKRYGEPHEFLLWYWPWNPKAYQIDPSLKWDFHDNWYWVNAFSRFRFVNDWEIKDLAKTLPPGKKYLIISSPDSEPNGAKIGRINYQDGTTAYTLTAI